MPLIRNHLLRVFLLATLQLAAFLPSVAWGVEAFVVKDIRLEGLERISAGTVYNYLPIAKGDRFEEARSGDILRALFKSGLFKDIRLRAEGQTLILTLKERESISEINLAGNSEIKTDDIIEALKKVGFAKGEVYDDSKMERVVQEMSRQYYSRGKYGVRITRNVRHLDGNRVAVDITISEGRAARIKAINIVGNQTFDEPTLLKQFKLSTPNLISFFTKTDQYSKQKLGADLESLKSYYLDHGFINFQVDSTQVSITPDRKDVYVTVNITEGAQFHIAEVKLAGELIVKPEELTRGISSREGMLFSRKDVTDSTKAITDRLGDEGYYFANVNAVPTIENESRTVRLTYFVEPGKRIYVRRIQFIGNTRTRDEVLRREMRQLEGAWISSSKINRSKARLQRLGYFDEVNIETTPVQGTGDQVDLTITVVEKSSGNLMLGVGYSQTQGAIFNANLSQNNFLGSGKNVSFNFNNSSVNRIYSLGFQDPYFSVDGVSRSINLSHQETNASNANITAFNTSTYSIGNSYGIPVSEFNTLLVGVEYENTSLTVNNPALEAPQVANFLSVEGNTYNTYRVTSGYSYDTRNRAIFPNGGVLSKVSSEVATPIGTLSYYKVNYDGRVYLPIAEDWTFALRARSGYGSQYGDTKLYPFFANYYVGGPQSLRGFRMNTVGPLDPEGRALGGNFLFAGGSELQTPVPFLSDVKSVRLSAFFDAGNVYNIGDNNAILGAKNGVDLGTMRYSAGLAANWMSPFGLVAVSIAQPFNKQVGDQTQRFQFTFGTTF
jgi:outer membrane protein insertion porin family